MEFNFVAQIFDDGIAYRKGVAIEEEALFDEKFVMSVLKQMYLAMKLTYKQIKSDDRTPSQRRDDLLQRFYEAGDA